MKLSSTLRSFIILSTAMCSSNALSAPLNIEGEYKVVYGNVKTMEISNPLAGESPEQIGRFSVWLVKADWDSLTTEEKLQTKYIMRLRGTLRGLVNPVDFSATHTMVGDNREYIIRSDGDQLYPVSGDPFCSTGEPMQVREQVNLVTGTGKYANLKSGTIMLKGTINNCPQLDDFGKNDLTVIPGQSSVVFE